MRSRAWTRTACASIVVWAAVAIAAAGPIEGRFRLVEQRYERGDVNLASQDLPVRVEFHREGGVLSGRIWAGDREESALPWPAFAGDAGPVPVEAVVVRDDVAAGEVSARYRVGPSPGDDLVLEIVETYRLVESGGALEGTMTVRFTGGTMNRGGFTLHRRFERER
jgi:hypothetical protein